jgi:hypothetical protein
MLVKEPPGVKAVAPRKVPTRPRIRSPLVAVVMLAVAVVPASPTAVAGAPESNGLAVSAPETPKANAVPAVTVPV